MSDAEVINELSSQINTSKTKLLNRYFDGKPEIAQVGLSLPPQMAMLQTVINWPRLIVQAYEERLDIEGFILGDNSDYDTRLWSWWQANNLDEESSMAHIEALVTGKAYIVVGVNEDDPSIPLITVEGPSTMTVTIDPRTRKPTRALRLYGTAGSQTDPPRATLLLPNETKFYVMSQRGWESDPDYEDIDHGFGEVLVAPLLNRARVNDRSGRSEMEDVLGITDAACRSMTNLQAAQELLAVPQRYALGVTPEDFQDDEGNPIPKWEAYLGNIFALQNGEAKVGSFSAAELTNFTTTMTFYARQASALSGISLSRFGIASEANPASGDAIQMDDATSMVKRAERMARQFSAGWERAMRLAVRLIDGDNVDISRLEVKWRDPSTPTRSAIADAAVKLYTANSPEEGALYPREGVWELMGLNPEQRRALAAKFTTDPLQALLRSTAEEDNRNGSEQLLPADGSAE